MKAEVTKESITLMRECLAQDKGLAVRMLAQIRMLESIGDKDLFREFLEREWDREDRREGRKELVTWAALLASGAALCAGLWLLIRGF